MRLRFRRHREGGLAIRGDVNFVGGILAGSQLNHPEIASGHHGRINESAQRNGRETDRVAILLGAGKRRSKFPSGGQLQAGHVGDVLGGVALRIEHHLVPAKDVEIGSRGGAGGIIRSLRLKSENQSLTSSDVTPGGISR